MRLEARLKINRLELHINLGWPAKERVKAQPVFLDIEISGTSLIKGAKSDNLKDTICYDVLATAIKERVNQREYKLIEHLGLDLFNLVKSHIPKKMKLKLAITKPHAPVEGLLGGAGFELEGKT